MQNTMKALMAYFETEITEFTAFWRELSDEDKEYFRTVNLETGRVES